MKTFLVLFALSFGLSAQAQRVKENIRQQSVIIDENLSSPVEEKQAEARPVVKGEAVVVPAKTVNDKVRK